jgi:hypothetical protein
MMEILVILVVALLAMLVAARFDNGALGNGQPYRPSEEPVHMSDDTHTDPAYSHMSDNFFYEDNHAPGE